VCAGRALRMPAVLRRALDLFALIQSATDKQQGGKHDAQASYSVGYVPLR